MVIVSTEWIGYDEEVKSGPNTLVMANSGTFSSNKNDNSGTNEWKQNQCNSRANNSVGCARIILQCQPNSHPFQTRTLILEPNAEVKVGRSIARSRVLENNAIFDCKVLSRNHAVLWYSEGAFYVKDTRSSNGTFINDRRIEQFEAESLNTGDVVKFGVDVIENSRKEVHGCIIASVRLYTPDGREYICSNPTRNKSGGGTISLDELQRLHHYIQEANQREKLLEVKLHDVQTVIETTRRNTSSCWQAMIDEDKLLNRIDILENKLQFFQKNVPEDRLKNEILKLQEDKYVYQNSAKEALRKVYQERMDALHKLTTIERALCNSEDECSLLRDQLLRTQQNLQEVNCRLTRLEDEMREKEEQNEQALKELEKEENEEMNAKLKEKDDECQDYKNQISILMMEKNTLQKQLEHYEDVNSDHNDSSPSKTNRSTSKSTIQKWFENSDLGQKEGSTEIIQAICSEMEAKDESPSTTIDFAKLREKLCSIQKQISCLETEVIHEKIEEDLNSTSAPSISDGNQNIEVACNDNDLLKKCTLALIDVSQDIDEYISELKERHDKNQCTEQRCIELKEKLNAVQQELEELQVELQMRPSYVQMQEKINENEIYENEMKSLKEKIVELESDVINLQNDKILLQDKIENSSLPEARNDVALQTSDISISSNVNDALDVNNDVDDDIIKTDLEILNNSAIQQEEELVAYKEKYQITTNENIVLKKEVAKLKDDIRNFQSKFLTKFLTYSIVFIGIFCYLLFSYF